MTTTQPAETATTAPGTSDPETTAATTSTPPEADALLASALAAYGPGYTFDATTVINDQEAVVQMGRWVGGSSQLTIRSGDGEVEYIITPEGQWTRLPGGEWQALDGTSTPVSPLDQLAAPTSLDLLAYENEAATVQALYPAEVLGFEGDPIAVVLDFRQGLLTAVTFTANAAGAVTESITTLGPLSDTTPVTAPG